MQLERIYELGAGTSWDRWFRRRGKTTQIARATLSRLGRHIYNGSFCFELGDLVFSRFLNAAESSCTFSRYGYGYGHH